MVKSEKHQAAAKGLAGRPAATPRSGKAGKRRANPAPAKRVHGAPPAATPVKSMAVRSGRGRAPAAKGARKSLAAPAFAIRELDPRRACGGATSVVQLFRADEVLTPGTAAKGRQSHLVFNDRHGWYCEHGRSCHAVSAVMRHAGIR